MAIEADAAKKERGGRVAMRDHPIVRQGLALLINREADLAVCGDAEEAGSALQGIEELKYAIAEMVQTHRPIQLEEEPEPVTKLKPAYPPPPGSARRRAT